MTEIKQKRKPRKYTDEFKQQLVDLYHSGKRRCDIGREYDIGHALFIMGKAGRKRRLFSRKRQPYTGTGRTVKAP